LQYDSFERGIRKMQQLMPPKAWMKIITDCAISTFRASIRNVFERNIVQLVCPDCRSLVTLTLDWFSDDGLIGLICLNCGAPLVLHPDNRIRLDQSGWRAHNSYRDYIKEILTAKGIDWQTGQSNRK